MLIYFHYIARLDDFTWLTPFSPYLLAAPAVAMRRFPAVFSFIYFLSPAVVFTPAAFTRDILFIFFASSPADTLSPFTLMLTRHSPALRCLTDITLLPSLAMMPGCRAKPLLPHAAA